MVKIVIMDDESILKETIDAVEKRKVQKEDWIIYFDSIDDFRKVLTKERMNVLRTARAQKPSSIYELAKMLGRNFKSVMFDARLLEDFGLLSLEKYKEGMRVKVRPVVKARMLKMEMKI
ncbi:hypothetical protein COV61_00310 [Candidatus Micrarchaeota archaeon CG11_big_fil_rev_8_21_14_0_20_47_5]|nr:MAG: hypothetical protein AUJ17_02535 [Candidatus Micrarchaeota archaeon CG1_02_47_40]PIN84384.1 MAG: hypothetical protein COV61_00310 [Candidatus Micrarchaeota archaeon CG11_big_fil_rev_8_21_14_0_20_47_5]